MKTEKHSARRRSGLTLVELIVVIGIIALLLGVAIPGIVSLASLGRGDFGNSARNLLGALRAAKMYSSTYRSITAVAYVYTEVQDSVLLLPDGSPAPVHIIDGFALVRKPVDRSEALKLAESWITDSQFNGELLRDNYGVAIDFNEQREFVADFFIGENIFFTLDNEEGNFRKFGRDAVILNAVPKTLEAFTAEDVEAVAEQQGLLSIRIIGPWVDQLPVTLEGPGDGLPDIILPNSAFLDDVNWAPPYMIPHPTLFPAHVFTPTGRILMSTSAAERVTLEVGPSPSLADNYRFGRDLTDDERMDGVADETGNALAQAEVVAERRFLEPILIELYQSTARVKFASEGL